MDDNYGNELSIGDKVAFVMNQTGNRIGKSNSNVTHSLQIGEVFNISPKKVTILVDPYRRTDGYSSKEDYDSCKRYLDAGKPSHLKDSLAISCSTVRVANYQVLKL
jgi:hypothetical protein